MPFDPTILKERVKEFLRINDNSLTDNEIDNFLKEAFYKVEADIGDIYFNYHFTITWLKPNQKIWFKLPYQPIDTTDIKVFLKEKITGNLIEFNTSDWEYNQNNNTIKILKEKTYFYGDVIIVRYIPEQLKVLVLYQAVADILRRSKIISVSEVEGLKLENIEKELERLREKFKQGNLRITFYKDNTEWWDHRFAWY